MKSFSIIVFAAVLAIGNALTVSHLVAFTLLSLGTPAYGFFGMFRRRSSPKSQLVEESVSPQGALGFNSGFQRQPNFFGSFGGFPRFPSFGGSMFPSNSFRPFSPFPGNFLGSQSSFPGNPSFPGSQSSFPGNPSSFPGSPSQFPGNPSSFPGSQPGFSQNSMRPAEMRSEDSEPQLNTEEAESFFTLLAETDENKCISRLVCELGADPRGAGELGTTISEIILSLTDFPDGSKVAEYNEVLQSGKNKGVSFCGAQFSACDEESYGLMKNAQAEQVAETDEN